MKIRRFALVLCVLALLAAACGGDDDDDNASSGGTSTTAPSGSTSECTTDKAVKVVGLAETTGEGAQAVPFFANGWELGVAAVNEAGGICGMPVDYERIAMSPTDNAQAKNSFLSALDKKADVLVGIVNSATVIALGADVARAQTPTIFFSSPPNAFMGFTGQGGVGSDYAFLIRPRTTGAATAQVDDLVNELGKKKIGLLCVNQTFGQQGCAAAKPAIEAAGGTVVDTETHEITDTNLTSKVLAFKNAGVDGIMAFTFPNTGVVFFNQLADNNVKVPVMTGAIAGLAIATKTLKPDAIANLYGFDDCAPAVESRAKDFAAAYQAKFGAPPSYSAAQAYDSLFIIKEAVEKSGKVDKAAITEALTSVSYKGACADYETDAGHGLAHSAVLETFGADGVPKVVKQLEIPAPANGG